MSRFDISFDPEDQDRIPQNKLDFYKAEKGRTDVIALISFRLVDDKVIKAARAKAAEKKKILSEEDAEIVREKWLKEQAQKRGKPLTMLERCGDYSSPKFGVYQVYYNQDLKILAVRDPDSMAADEDRIWNRLAEPRTQITTVLLSYPVTREGEVDVDRAMKNFRIMPWKFGPGVYEKLKKQQVAAQKNKTALGLQDIQITCKDTTYQNIELTLNGPATWMSWPDALKEQILTKAYQVATGDQAVPGRIMTTSQLKEKLGIKDQAAPQISLSSDSDEEPSGGGDDGGGDAEGDDLLAGLLP